MWSDDDKNEKKTFKMENLLIKFFCFTKFTFYDSQCMKRLLENVLLMKSL